MNKDYSTGIGISHSLIDYDYRSCPCNSEILRCCSILIILVVSIIFSVNCVVLSTQFDSSDDLAVNNAESAYCSIIDSDCDGSFHTITYRNNNLRSVSVNCIININCDSDIVFRYNETSLIGTWQVVIITNISHSHIIKTLF